MFLKKGKLTLHFYEYVNHYFCEWIKIVPSQEIKQIKLQLTVYTSLHEIRPGDMPFISIILNTVEVPPSLVTRQRQYYGSTLNDRNVVSFSMLMKFVL